MTSSDQITVTAGMYEVVQDMKAFEAAMDGELEQLYNQFRSLFAGDWTGQAQEACDQARAQWGQGAEEVKAALHNVAVALQNALDSMFHLDLSLAKQLEA